MRPNREILGEHRLVVRIPADRLRFLLSLPEAHGGPCPSGRQWLLDLCGVLSVEGLTAKKLQQALVRAAERGTPQSTYWLWSNVRRTGATAEQGAHFGWDDTLRMKAFRAYAGQEAAAVLEGFDVRFYEPSGPVGRGARG
jgi:hypothetical protein